MDERLLVLTPDIWPIYPALNYAHSQSTLRTMNLWLLQGVNQRCPDNGERYRQPWEMSRAEFFVYRTVAEDFASRAALGGAGHAASRAFPGAGGNSTSSSISPATRSSRRPSGTTARQGEIEGYKLYVREERAS